MEYANVEALPRATSGGIDCAKGCVPDAATFGACVASLLDPAVDMYPVGVCTRCHVTLLEAADVQDQKRPGESDA